MPFDTRTTGDHVPAGNQIHKLIFAAFLCLSFVSRSPAKWAYYRDGKSTDSAAAPKAGFALMGGGGKLEDAYKFLCERTGGGDFLILRAATDEAYARHVNKEMLALCPLNSAATIVFTEREDSDDGKLAEIIGNAEAIFIAGGDQSNYVRFWQDTPVQDALNRHIATLKPIGGSSAGLAILGEFAFASIIDTIHSPEALANPYGNKVTLSRNFLKIPLLRGAITDTHFVKRDRLGRLLVFLARILADRWSKEVRAIAVEENAAVLLEPDGTAVVSGDGPAYFLEAAGLPEVCKDQTPLSFSGIKVHRVPPGGRFDVRAWKGKDGSNYMLSVENGVVRATGALHNVYE
jgi:cyanophycinase